MTDRSRPCLVLSPARAVDRWAVRGARPGERVSFLLGIGAGAVVFALLLCTPCSAAPASLRWSAPAECPDASDVEGRVGAIVGKALAVTLDADVVVRRTEQARYGAVVRVRSRDGRVWERSLEEATCELVADAAATVVAMSLEASASSHDAPDAGAAPPERPASPETPSPPQAPRDVGASPSPKRSSGASEPRFAAGLVAMADEGTLPSPAVGGGVVLAWYPLPPLRIEAALLRWIDQSATVPNQTFGGTFQLTTADLRSCWSLLGRTVTVGPCAGIEVAHVEAKGFKSTTSENGEATWWSPSAGGLLRWMPLRTIGFGALADVVFPVARPTFVIVNGGSIHQAASHSLRGQIVAEVRF